MERDALNFPQATLAPAPQERNPATPARPARRRPRRASSQSRREGVARAAPWHRVERQGGSRGRPCSLQTVSSRRGVEPPRSRLIWIGDVENHTLDLSHEPDRFHSTNAPDPAALPGPAAEWSASIPVRSRLIHVHHPTLESL